jgi:hypothetical protein
MISRCVFQRFDYNSYTSFGSSETETVEVKKTERMKDEVSYPSAKASKGLHFPSLDRTPDWL